MKPYDIALAQYLKEHNGSTQQSFNSFIATYEKRKTGSSKNYITHYIKRALLPTSVESLQWQQPHGNSKIYAKRYPNKKRVLIINNNDVYESFSDYNPGNGIATKQTLEQVNELLLVAAIDNHI